MLPEKVVMAIEKGPQRFFTGSVSVYETPEEFATRIAELATRLEREACVKVCEELIDYDYGSAAQCARAIEARGK